MNMQCEVRKNKVFVSEINDRSIGMIAINIFRSFFLSPAFRIRNNQSKLIVSIVNKLPVHKRKLQLRLTSHLKLVF